MTRLAPGSCVRLFLSADLVGSTSFKNQSEKDSSSYSQEHGPSWAKVFKDFYLG